LSVVVIDDQVECDQFKYNKYKKRAVFG